MTQETGKQPAGTAAPVKTDSGQCALGSMQKESDINKDSLSAQCCWSKPLRRIPSAAWAKRCAAADGYSVHGEKRHGGVASLGEANPELTGTLMKVAAVVAAVPWASAPWLWCWLQCWGRWQDPSGILCAGYQNVTFRYGSRTRTSSALSWLAGAPLAVLRPGLLHRVTQRVYLLRRCRLCPYGITDGKCPENCSRCAGCTLRSGLSALRAVAVMFMNPLGYCAVDWLPQARCFVCWHLVAGDAARCPVCRIWSVRCSAHPIGLVVTALTGVALVVWKYCNPSPHFSVAWWKDSKRRQVHQCSIRTT